MPNPDCPLETEVKLRLAPEARATLEQHSALCPPRASAPVERHLISTYFDTADGILRRHGFSLRVRANGSDRVQTLKRSNAASSIERGEWEWPIETDTPRAELLAGTPAADLIEQCGGALRRVSTSDIRRTVRMAELPPATRAEISVDTGRIEAGDAREPILELEIELKEGRAGPIYALALELAQSAPVALEPASKAERGAILAGAAPPAAVKAADLALGEGLSGAHAFRAVVASVLGHLMANVGPAARGDVEGVHQIRVAVRRLRAAFGLFKPLLSTQATTRFDAELKRLGREFGEARDWDVLVVETLPAAVAHSAEPGWLELVTHRAELRRAAAHAAVARELAGPAFTGLVLALAGWAEDGADDPSLLGSAALAHPITKLAPRLLSRMARKVAKRGRALDGGSASALHELRKSIKKLRYAVEFLESLYRHKEVKVYLHPCKDLQELLGKVNDAHAVPALAGRLAEVGRADLAPAIVALGRWSELRGANALRRVAKPWREFERAKPFWD